MSGGQSASGYAGVEPVDSAESVVHFIVVVLALVPFDMLAVSVDLRVVDELSVVSGSLLVDWEVLPVSVDLRVVDEAAVVPGALVDDWVVLAASVDLRVVDELSVVSGFLLVDCEALSVPVDLRVVDEASVVPGVLVDDWEVLGVSVNLGVVKELSVVSVIQVEDGEEFGILAVVECPDDSVDVLVDPMVVVEGLEGTVCVGPAAVVGTQVVEVAAVLSMVCDVAVHPAACG